MNKQSNFQWHFVLKLLLVMTLALIWFVLNVYFDIPERFYYEEKQWDIPTDPREKAAYDHAHAIELPKKVPDGGFVFYTVNKEFNRGYAANNKTNPVLFKTIVKEFPEPKPFDFVQARINSMFGGDAVRLKYFDHLCETEAGEYIYKKVNDVDGLYQMRPMPKRSESLIFDRYGFEDPANWTAGQADGPPSQFIVPPYNKFKMEKFNFYETSQSPSEMPHASSRKQWQVEQPPEGKEAPYWHYTIFKLPKPPAAINDRYALRAIPIDQPTAKYAYTWRGIKRPLDRRYGIAGGELIVLNRETNEVLGFRRAFAASRPLKRQPRASAWEHAVICPRVPDHNGLPMPNVLKLGYSYHFINQIFKPLLEGYGRYHFRSIGEDELIK